MKTTLDLPEELMRAVKIRAVQENRKLKDMVAKLLELGLAHEPGEPGTARERVQLPLVQCAREAPPRRRDDTGPRGRGPARGGEAEGLRWCS